MLTFGWWTGGTGWRWLLTRLVIRNKLIRCWLAWAGILRSVWVSRSLGTLAWILSGTVATLFTEHSFLFRGWFFTGLNEVDVTVAIWSWRLLVLEVLRSVGIWLSLWSVWIGGAKAAILLQAFLHLAALIVV